MNGEHKPTSTSRVALYARVSSDRQAHEATIDSQVSLLRERIATDGGTVEPTLCFIDDGVSGTTLVRPALERLRDQAAAGVIDRLYVLTPDRLARRHAHQMVLVEEFVACGMEVVFVNRPVGTTPEDQLLLQVQGVISEYERAKILERTRRGRLHAARCGRVSVLSRAPYGYRYIDKVTGGGSAAYEVIEDEARVVRQIFDWVGRERCSMRGVMCRLQKLGICSPRGYSRWQPSTIRALLRNPAYRGQAAYGKTGPRERRRLRPRRGCPEVPKNPHGREERPATDQIAIPVPALVDEDLFATVQEQLAENRSRLRQRRTGVSFFLQGLVVCSICGYALCGRKRPGRRRPYYRCLGLDGYRLLGRRVCDNRPYLAEDLDAAVWNDVCLLLKEPDRLRQEFERRQQSSTSDDMVQTERLRTASKKIKQSISRLIDAYSAGLVEADEFEPRIKQLKERLAKSDGELRLLAQQAKENETLRLVFSSFDDFAEQVNESLMTADCAQRREILRALVKRVEVDKETVHIVYKVPARPFASGPKRGLVQHCTSRLRHPHLTPCSAMKRAYQILESEGLQSSSLPASVIKRPKNPRI